MDNFTFGELIAMHSAMESRVEQERKTLQTSTYIDEVEGLRDALTCALHEHEQLMDKLQTMMNNY